MPNIEIDETQYKQMTQQQKFLVDALSNPKARALLLKAQKELNPAAVIPEIDARDAVLEEVGKVSQEMVKLREELSKRDEELTKREVESKLAAQWASGRSKANKLGYDGEALEALEKFMEEKGIADHDIAIPAFEKFHPQAQPVASNANKFDFFNRSQASDDKLAKQLWDGDIDGFTDTAIADTLKTMRGIAA